MTSGCVARDGAAAGTLRAGTEVVGAPPTLIGLTLTVFGSVATGSMVGVPTPALSAAPPPVPFRTASVTGGGRGDLRSPTEVVIGGGGGGGGGGVFPATAWAGMVGDTGGGATGIGRSGSEVAAVPPVAPGLGCGGTSS